MSGGRLGGRSAPYAGKGVWYLAEASDRIRLGLLSIAYLDAVMLRSPSGLYLFEEGSGTQLTDSSGNANHGSYLNSALPSTPGLITQGAKSLNAVSNQYANAPGAVASSTSGFSIVMWVQWSHSTNQIICERNANAGYSIQNYDGANAGKIGVTSSNPSAFLYLVSSIAINDGNPHCVVFVFGATAAASYIYIDGVDRTTRPNGNASPSYGSTTVWDIGARAGTLAMNGRIDAVSFHPSLLSLADAQALNTAGRAPQ